MNVSLAAVKMVEEIYSAVDDAALAIEKAALDRKKALLETLDEEDRKKLSDQGTKEGDIAREIRKKLTEKLLVPQKLEACYSKLAADAVDKRNIAAVEYAEVKNDDTAKRANAELKLRETTRAIVTAYEKLQAKEKLIKVDISRYREARINEIKKAKLKMDSRDAVKPDKDKPFEDLINAAEAAKFEPKDGAAEPDNLEPKDSKEPSCTD